MQVAHFPVVLEEEASAAGIAIVAVPAEARARPHISFA
jgi:hypothetical protein